MKLIKFLLWMLAVAIIPLCTVVMADDCFDTVIDENGKVYYIDPFDKWSVFEKKESLIGIYWDEIKCTWEKKVYTENEYFNEIYDNLQKQSQLQGKKSGWWSSFIELVMLILWCVAMRKIFVKAWKPGINSIIPIYSFYEMSDIAWLSWLFKKAVRCLIVWFLMIFITLFVMPIALFPQIWMILICIFWLYMCAVNFYMARNFWWSTIASILYVIFNPIAILVLAFWNDKYYLTEQKEKVKEINRKMQIEEGFSTNSWENKMTPSDWINEDMNIDSLPENNSQTDEDPIKYIDPSQFK